MGVDVEECEVRLLHGGMSAMVSKIVGVAGADKLYRRNSPINKTLAGVAGCICAACWKASAGTGVRMDDRQPICQRALLEYVQGVATFHRAHGIRSLPGFLRTRYANMTEAPVSDEILAELRELERASGVRRANTGEPQRLGETPHNIMPSPSPG
jgi:hypothetical protein